MANLEEKIERNRRFIDAVDYLIETHVFESQKELSEYTGIMEATISNVRQNRKGVSDKTIRKLIEKFPNVFDINYFKMKPVSMILEKEQTKKSISQEQADAMLFRQTEQEKEMEELRRMLKATLEKVDLLTEKLDQAIRHQKGSEYILSPSKTLATAENPDSVLPSNT